MGDGHHAWASAEWMMIMRNMFVREEQDRLILASGIVPELLEPGKPLSFGPTPTSFGPITLWIEPGKSGVQVSWKAHWRILPQSSGVALPVQLVQHVEAAQEEHEVNIMSIN